MTSAYDNEAEAPFIPKSNLEEGTEQVSSQPNSDPYQAYYVEYKGEQLYIDTKHWKHSKLLKCQLIAFFCSFVLFGMVEQAVGTLIPVFQKEYKVNDVQTSFLFLSSITGYIVMGVFNGMLHQALGLRGIFWLGTGSMVVAYTMFSLAPPFWILVVFATFSGIGLGSMDGAGNSWVSQLMDSNQLLGLLHGCYGLGCMISPSLISTLIERKKDPWKWNHYYALLATLALINCVSLAVFFRFETVGKYRYLSEVRSGTIDKSGIELRDFSGDDYSQDDIESGRDATFKEVLQSKLVWVIAIILFFYVGGEYAFGSWLISYLLRINKLSYKVSSYIDTTFWFGIMMGRTCLGFVTAHFFSTELTANLVYIGGAVVANTIFYMVSFTNQVWSFFLFVFISGLFAGPVFPTTIVASVGILPASLHTSGVGFACAFGGGGAAAIPFVIGAIAESSTTGLKMFPLIIVFIHVALFITWALVTRKFSPTYQRPGVSH